MKFKKLLERHEQTVAEFVVNELAKRNLGAVMTGDDVYFTKYKNIVNLGFKNPLGASFECKNGKINVNLPSYNSAKDMSLDTYMDYIGDMNVFLKKLNNLVSNLSETDYNIYDSSMLKELETKYRKYM